MLLTVYDKKLHEKTLREEGSRNTLNTILLDILGEKGSVSQRLRTAIAAEDDLEILHSWIKLAVHVESIEEFEEKTVR